MGHCSKCKFPMQIKSSMICAITREYIYPPAYWGCNENFSESKLPFAEQMKITAKEKGFEFVKTDESVFHGHPFKINIYE